VSKDNTCQWTFPAISLGFAVEQDTEGRFRFFDSRGTLEIVWRNDIWVARDGDGEDRIYTDIGEALPIEGDNLSGFDTDPT